jgi:hypothetical protein
MHGGAAVSHTEKRTVVLWQHFLHYKTWTFKLCILIQK